MKFIETIHSSIYDPEFYESLKHKSFSFSVAYFLKLALIASFIFGVYTAVTIAPKVVDSINSYGLRALALYPDNLEVKIIDGIVSTNVSEPFVIPLPDEYKKSQSVEETSLGLINLLVIDTKKDFNRKIFNDYKTYTLVTKDSVIYREGGNRITIESLNKIPNITLNKQFVSSIITKILSYSRSLEMFLPLIFFIGFFIAFLFHFIYFFIAGLLVWIIAKIKKIDLTYKKSYQISIHAMTLGVIISLVFNFLSIYLFPYCLTIILGIVAWVNLKPRSSHHVS